MRSLIAKAGMISATAVGRGHRRARGGFWSACSDHQRAESRLIPQRGEPYGATPEQQKRHLELFREGQALWPIYCNHCHNARNPAEFAPYQWDQIMMHMRTLENLPPHDQDAILEYLKTAR